MTLAADDPRHGTANGYKNHRCRCGACREAWRIDYTARAHRLGYYRPRAVYLAERYSEPPPHGTESRYRRGCHCDQCRAATAEGKRRRRAAQPELYREIDRRSKCKAATNG